MADGAMSEMFLVAALGGFVLISWLGLLMVLSVIVRIDRFPPILRVILVLAVLAVAPVPYFVAKGWHRDWQADAIALERADGAVEPARLPL